VSVGIYNDPGLDCIARASTSRWMFQMLQAEWTDGQMDGRTDGVLDEWVDECSGTEAARATDRKVSGAVDGKGAGRAKVAGVGDPPICATLAHLNTTAPLSASPTTRFQSIKLEQ
jgi:hypothetical protein